MERVPEAGEGVINMYIFIELKAKPTFYIIVVFNENVEHDLHLSIFQFYMERVPEAGEGFINSYLIAIKQ